MQKTFSGADDMYELSNIKGIEIRHIKAFDAVVKTRSFSEAAKQLNTVQPALSRCVKELEDIFHTQLIDRTTRPIKLTLAGETFHKHVRTILHRLEISVHDVHKISKSQHGSIKIAVSDDVNMSLISDILAQFREDSPEIEIQFVEVNLQTQLAGLRKGDFDAGFCRYPIGNDPEIKSICAYQENLIVVLPKRHPLLQEKTIEIDQFLSQGIIFYHPEHLQGSYQQVIQKITTTDIKPFISHYARSFEFMLSLVSAGFGISMMGESRKDTANSINVASRPFTNRITLDTYLLYSMRSSNILKPFIYRANSLRIA